MKLVDSFSEFLRETVNLNQTRIDLLSDSISALKDFVRQADWAPHIKGFEEQGSWAHDTIIKPVDGGEFDADLLVLVEPVSEWSAADYVNKLGSIFVNSATYADKVKIWDYCITITYAGERKVDIAPCVVGRLFDGSFEVCNRPKDEFRRTAPAEYTAWVKERNGYSGSNSFRKVTRLIKYLRDIKERFRCPSVLLTTLVGYQINWFDKDSAAFSDTPTTLQTIMGRLDDWLQLNPSKPRVENPKLSSEDLAELWTDKQYENFRTSIHIYRGFVDEAFAADDRVSSIEGWRKVFGEDFARGEETSSVVALSEDGSRVRQLLMATAAHLDELVDAVKNFGIKILPAEFSKPPHLHPPRWIRDWGANIPMRVAAEWRPSRDGGQPIPVKTGEVLSPRGGLWLRSVIGDGHGLPPGHSVEWRIANTGVVAFARKEQRGGFYPSQRIDRRWEELRYRGVHMAEAFLIRDRDDALVGQSPPFYVVIE